MSWKRETRRRSLGRTALVTVAVAAACGICAAGAAAENPLPGQSTWVYASKDLRDPTFTYTENLYCNSATPSGQDTLYPYYVPTRGYEFEWRNESTSGVTVTPNSTETDDIDDTGIALFVTSIHIEGNYALKVSYECQSNAPDGAGRALPPTLKSVSASSATISAPFQSKVSSGSSFRYFVQYGTGYADYTQQTPAQEVSWAEGSRTVEIAIPNLKPGTTYHYRVAIQDTDPNLPYKFTSFSGEDQTFTTAASGAGSATPAVSEIALGSGEGMRVAAPEAAGEVPSLTANSRSAAEQWGLTDPGTGVATKLVSVKTGLCLDLDSRSEAPGAGVVTRRCRPRVASQAWVQRRAGGRLRLVNAKSGEVLGMKSGSHRVVQAPLRSRADRGLGLPASDGGSARPKEARPGPRGAGPSPAD